MKQTLLIIISAVIILMTSCSGGEKKAIPPDNIIPRDEMIDIVTEAWIIENAIVYWYRDSLDHITYISTSLYADLFDKYNITKDQFIQSSEYYLKTGPDSEEFVNECIQRLEERKDEFSEGLDLTSRPQ